MRYEIEIEGRKVRLINNVVLVMAPEHRPNAACSWSAPVARKWQAYLLAEKGIVSTLVPTGGA